MRTTAVRRAATAAVAVLFWACDAAPEAQELTPEPPLRGARLVVGSSVEQWSLLAVPRDGGQVQTRSLSNPVRILATGVADVPASDEAFVLSDGLVVLRGTDGIAYTYDPPSDALVRVGEVEPEAVWTGGGSVGVFFSATGSVLEISRDGVWRYAIEDVVHWAAPADDGVVAIIERETGDRIVWVLRRDEDQPAETGEVDAGVPAVVTAWGQRIILTAPGGAGLTILTTEPVEQAGEVSLDGRVTGLTTSPSTHEIYVIADDPPRLESVNRFSLSARVLQTFVSPPEAVRASLFGEAILVSDGQSVHAVPVTGSATARVSSVWRSDLPIGLPDGSVLVGGETGVSLEHPAGGEPATLEGAGLERWWLPVPWTPSTAPVTADRIPGEAVATGDGEAPSERPDTALGADTGAGASDLDRPGVTATGQDGVPAGFYAIVGSARQREGMRELIESLEAAGFATQIQTFPDEAGRTWHRGLVGPYRSRSEAEAAARQLLRERRLEAWVTEIGADTRREEAPA